MSDECRPDDATERAQLEKMRSALRQAGNQFEFYAGEHRIKGADAKAATNQWFADLCRSAMDVGNDPETKP